MNAPNRNVLWAEIVVDELARAGLRHVVIAPGSRNTPFVLAFAAHPDITVHLHLDERGAAFYALGLGLATDQPAAVLCTSGTAAANFFPAIIEANQSRVPLLVLTADRSPELRDSGANQTIDQIKLYGDQVLWAVDVGLPESDPPPVVLRGLRTLAARAYATANGDRKGPVHLNFPLRKPLEPIPVPTDQTAIPASAAAHPDSTPFAAIWRGEPRRLTESQTEALVNVIGGVERGLIVCGPRLPEDAAGPILALAAKSGYPVLADPLSGVRFHPDIENGAVVVGGYDTFLMGDPGLDAPDVIVRFGSVPTSKWLNEYLARITPAARLHISASGTWADDAHQTTHLIHADEAAACAQLSERLSERGATTWTEQVAALENDLWPRLLPALRQGEWFDGAALDVLMDVIPDDSALFMGNSLPVRHFDQFARPMAKRLHVYGNRGASGIDGVISSAFGAAAAHPSRPLTLVIGDVSFYHDLNGLLAARHISAPVTIVLLNNDGGGIFHRLPIKDFEPTFTDLFITPHGLNFEHAARLFNLPYTVIDAATDPAVGDTFRTAYAEAVTAPGVKIIEIRTDSRLDVTRRRAVLDEVFTSPPTPSP